MKKTLFLLASAVILLAGCNKERFGQNAVSDGETVEVNVETSLPMATTASKAVWDNDGNAANVDHWIMEVYDKDDSLYDRKELTGQTGLTKTFKVTLIKNQTYKFVFWADTEGSYETSDLTDIKTILSSDSREAGKDDLDAFYCKKEYTSTKNESISAVLNRPFGQVNIVTLDTKKIFDEIGDAAEYGKFIPKNLKVTATVYNGFNALEDTLANPKEVTLTELECYGKTPYSYTEHKDSTTLFMDYIFVGAEQELVDLAFEFESNGEKVEYAFASIPFQRNYRTNIFGNLLSNDAEWTVVVDPIWNQPDFDIHTYTPSYEDLTSTIEAAATGDKITVNGVSFTKADDGFCYADPENEKGRLVYMKSISTPGSSTASTTFTPNTGASPVDLQGFLLGSKGRLEAPGSYLKSTDIIALPEGTVYYKNQGTSAIVDTYGDITFLGAGQDKTVIAAVQTPGSGNYRFFRIYNRYAKCIDEDIIYKFNFENLTIDGAGEANASANCFVVTCYNIAMNLKNVTIKNFGGSAFSVWANDSLNAAGYSGDWTDFYFGGYDGNGKPLYYPTKAMDCGVEINLEACTIKGNGRLVHFDAAPYVSGNNSGGYGFIHLNFDSDCTIDNGEIYDVVASVKKGEGNCLLNGVDVWPAE